MQKEATATVIVTFDLDGYPTDKMLESISAYLGNWNEFMQKLQPLFSKYGRCEYRHIDKTWEVSTGGWSDNESIINAMQENMLFWQMTWRLSKRGGYYEFRT